MLQYTKDFVLEKVTFWVKNSVSWARSALLHGIYCIFYWVKFVITRKNNAFVAKIVNMCLTKIIMTTFAHDERLPSSATLIRNHITLLFEPVDADEALFVRTQSLVHWDVACVWSQTRCLTKCETITSLGMCGVCQKDNVTLSRRLLCKYSIPPFCPPPHQPCECCKCCGSRRCPSWKCVSEHLF